MSVKNSPEDGEPRKPWPIRVIHGFEDAALCLLLTGMIGLAVAQILLRNFWDTGLPWADPALRAGVLWLGLLGALAASRDRRQITVDVLSRFLEGRWRLGAQLIANSFTAAVAALLAWHCGRFIAGEIEFETVAFAGIPSWWLQLVLPVAFGFIALRYAMHALADLWSMRASPEVL